MKALAAAVLLSTAVAAQASVLTFYASFAPEAVGATGSGSATFTFDDVTNVLHYTGSFSGLSANATAAHFHCCTAVPNAGNAGVAVVTPSLPGFPLGVTAGSFDNSLDLDLAASFNPAFVTASGSVNQARDRFIQNIYEQRVYFNIHSTAFPGGEIRGFLVPEPTSAALALAALLALGATGAARRRG